MLEALEWLADELLPGAVLTVNDRIDLAMLASARSIHLGDRDLAPAFARRILGEDALIGLSTHSVEEARRGAAGPIDYVAIGPVFESRTKTSGRVALGVDVIGRAAREIDKPVIAIGGIDRVRIPELFAAGVESVAVIGEVWSAPDPVGTAVAFLDLVVSEREKSLRSEAS